MRKNDFILHIKNTGMFGLFDKTDPESETHWQNVAITAFKWEHCIKLKALLCYDIYDTYIIAYIDFRLFDKNYDGYIDKKEFKWMTTSEIISNRTINTVFEVDI